MLHRACRPITTLYDAVKAGRLLWYRCDCGNVGWFNPATEIPTARLDLCLSASPAHLRCIECGTLGASVVAPWPIGDGIKGRH
jgi:hypothetical protein